LFVGRCFFFDERGICSVSFCFGVMFLFETLFQKPRQRRAGGASLRTVIRSKAQTRHRARLYREFFSLLQKRSPFDHYKPFDQDLNNPKQW